MIQALLKNKWIFSLLLFAETALSADLLDKVLRETIVYQPVIEASSGKIFTIRINLYQPAGNGPFPLVILNHGIDPDGNPNERTRFHVAAREFVKRGYVVMAPQRFGFGGSEGPFDTVPCQPESYASRSLQELNATLSHARQLPYVDNEKIIIAGHSVGGLITMKAGEQEMQGVKGLINMAGGYNWPDCDWKTPLMATMQQAGHSSLPSLWVYTENDSLFSIELGQAMFESYRENWLNTNGAHVVMPRFVALKPFANEGHAFFQWQDGVQFWWPPVAMFLTELGLPTAIVTDITAPSRNEASGFASIHDVESVPFSERNKESGREAYKQFLAAESPRAFALSEDGDSWGWFDKQNNVLEDALEICNNNTLKACRIYANDGDVVW